MTQFTDEQLEAASTRAATKLQAFYHGLSDDEWLVLGLAARRLRAGDETDTQGHMINHRDESPRPLPEEPNGLIPYRILSPTLYTMITPTYRVSV